jgi:hypothetical protein
MRHIYEGVVNINMKSDVSVSGYDVKSSVTFKTAKYSDETIYVGGQLPLGSKVWVIVTDVNPEELRFDPTVLTGVDPIEAASKDPSNGGQF